MLVFLILLSCRQPVKKEAAADHYICPMDTQITQPGPGICPICKMELITLEEYRSSGSDWHLSALLNPTYSDVVSTISLVLPVEKKLPVQYAATGFIEYDSRNLTNISSRYAGRIEKLYIKNVFQPISKGQKLFDIYSPEIWTAQENLIYLLRKDTASTDLIKAMKQKLRLYGFTEIQLKAIEINLAPEQPLSVYSPAAGYVYESLTNSVIQATPGESMGMNANGGESADLAVGGSANARFTLREGMYVRKGQTLFNVVNPSKVRAILMINAGDMSKIKTGQQVELAIENNPDSIVRGAIDFVEPVMENKSVNTRVRVYLDNPGNSIKAGNWVQATIRGEPAEGLWIPSKSVLRLGQQNMVWMKGDAALKAHRIKTGRTLGDWVEVTEGLWDDDSIAADAQYLMDSESLIKTSDADEK